MDSWFLWWSTKCCLCWVPELVPRPKDSVPYLTLVALVYLSKSQSSLALLATVKLRHSQPPFTHGQFLRGGDVNAKQMAAKGYNVSWLAHVPLKVLTYIYIFTCPELYGHICNPAWHVCRLEWLSPGLQTLVWIITTGIQTSWNSSFLPRWCFFDALTFKIRAFVLYFKYIYIYIYLYLSIYFFLNF